jgi:pyrimidine deaminase RibD-like protein
MRLAVRAARKSVDEDERAHPRVGVVVAKNGEILTVAHRGETSAGDHAEFVALERKLAEDVVAGATVYTTLEPCTTRNHPKIPCVQRLIERHIGRVVIGMVDPDPRIRGEGIRRLERARIAVDKFPQELVEELLDLNRFFIKTKESELPE